ncbi:MAG: immunity 53 family protein [Pirellulales bacterium]|nr:immunity 53 family protein [Pirellulales bacterium]
MTDLLSGSQAWYRRNCDWEHRFGITLETLDNPGWLLKVDLTATPLHSKPFAPVSHGLLPGNMTAADWLDCRVEDNRFLGAGSDLPTVVRMLLEWSR